MRAPLQASLRPLGREAALSAGSTTLAIAGEYCEVNDIADNILPGPWMQTVANILSLPHRAAMPFTLGEAVAEHGLWAKHARADAWNLSINRDSLDLDIRQLAATVGPRLGSLLQPQLNQLHLVPARADIVDRAERFDSIWRQRESIIAAFRDLCEAAAQPHGTSWDLRKLADILASQLGPSAHGAWSALSEAATALAGEPQEASLSRWLGKEASIADVSLANRLRVAEERIVANPPTGDVVVWLVYQRAMVSSWQIHAAPLLSYTPLGRCPMPAERTDKSSQNAMSYASS